MFTTAIRKGSPTAADVHIDSALTMISIAFSQGEEKFIAGKVFPAVPVMKQSDRYFIFDRENWIVGGAQKRADTAQSAGGDFTLSQDSYFAENWALHKDIGSHLRANADVPIRPDQNATEWVTLNMMITRESEWASDFFATGVWGTEQEGKTGSPSAPDFKFWSESGSTPIADLTAAIVSMAGATGFKPNKLVLGMEVWFVLKEHQDFLDRIIGGAIPGTPAIVQRQLLAQILELDEVLVAEGVQNTAPEGATEATDFIIGKNALLVHAATSPAIETPTAGYTFEWTGLNGAGSNGMVISKERIPLSGGADRIEANQAYVHKVVAAELGHFFLTAIA